MKEIPLVGLVATKNPTPALRATTRSLLKGGCDRVVIINDGSDELSSTLVLRKIQRWRRVEVINLKKNVGKSEALRVGYRSLEKRCIIVQTDDDTIAGNLRIPKQLVLDRKADIVDIRIEVTASDTLIGTAQEIGYWLLNAIVKKIQSLLQARTWLSGASIMYSYQAGRPILMEKSSSMTEDTEGLYRALAKGFRVKYCSKTKAQFSTMSPQSVHDLYKQWRRWSIGNGQLIGKYRQAGFRATMMNLITWVSMIAPIPTVILNGAYETILWTFAGSIVSGVLCAVWLRRPLVVLGSFVLPFLAMMWCGQSFAGLYLAYKLRGKKEMTWVSPKRMVLEGV